MNEEHLKIIHPKLAMEFTMLTLNIEGMQQKLNQVRMEIARSIKEHEDKTKSDNVKDLKKA